MPAADGLAVPRHRAYAIFATVGLSLLMSSLSATIVMVSVPVLLTDLNTNLAWIGWTITGYQFAQGVVMPIVGRLSRKWGRKRIFLVAAVLFTLSSIAAGLAPDIYWLIVFRVVQGASAGVFMPGATGIVADTFGSKRDAAIGLFGSIFAIGTILGPNIGGFILDHFSWRWIFFVNAPMGVLLVFLSAAVLPRDGARSSGKKLDLAGAGLFIGGILSLMYGMTAWADDPEHAGAGVFALFAAGLALLFLFMRRAARTAHPLIEVKLLRLRPFMAANVFNFFLGAAIIGFLSFIPYYATIAYDMTASESGLLLTPRSVAIILFSGATSLLISRLRYRMPMIVGMVVMALGLFLLSLGLHDASVLGVGLHSMVLLSLIVMITGIGIGVANPAANNAVLDLYPEKAAEVAGVRGLFRSVGGIFGASGVVLGLSLYADKVRGMEEIFLAFAVLTVLVIPIIFLIPDKANGKS